MANTTLTQTGAQVQADLDKVEGMAEIKTIGSGLVLSSAGELSASGGVGVIVTSPDATLTNEQVAILEQYEERTILILHVSASGRDDYGYLKCTGKFTFSGEDITYYNFKSLITDGSGKEVTETEHLYEIRNHVCIGNQITTTVCRALCLHSIEYDTDKHLYIISTYKDPVDPNDLISSLTDILSSASSILIRLGTQTEIWKQVINIHYASQTEVACVYYDESTQALTTEVIAVANLTNDDVYRL